jgi:ATP:ADP antiporter, AAA family
MPSLRALLIRLTRAEPAELAASLWSFIYFFSLLAGYYVLRPIRDEMAIQVGQAKLHELFLGVFVTMLVVAPVFGWLTRTFPRRRLLPWLYAFFVANLGVFWLLFDAGHGAQAEVVARAFFVWVSVFNLFAISVFWSFMADLFATAQAKRLYGFISAGGTVGALAGPALTAGFVTLVGVRSMLLVSAGFLAVAIVAIVNLRAWAARADATRQRADPAKLAAADRKAEQPIGGSIWAGITDIVRSPYLLAICFFLFAYSLLSTLLYFQQTELVPAAISDSAERTQLLALVDMAVNLLTLAVQVFAFGALIRRLGTTFMLCEMPVVAIFGFAALALSPVLPMLVVFGVIRRTGEYAVSKPARETLFNALPPEQKYKAKNVIDTLVHRTGDTASSWIFAGLKSIGLPLTTMSWLAVPVSAAWLGVALWLGRAATRKEREAAAAPPGAGAAAAG